MRAAPTVTQYRAALLAVRIPSYLRGGEDVDSEFAPPQLDLQHSPGSAYELTLSYPGVTTCKLVPCRLGNANPTASAILWVQVVCDLVVGASVNDNELPALDSAKLVEVMHRVSGV